MKENNIEWYTGQDTVTASFTQAKYVNKIRKFAEKDARVEILAENSDGSILVHLPLEYIRLNAKPKRRELTEEEREALRERIKRAQERRSNGDNS